MSCFLQEGKTVKIVYFSGTGSTARVADCFEKAFQEKGIEVSKSQLREGEKPVSGDEGLLLVLYAVHACNAPEPVYDWINSISYVNGIPSAVISVSGGGEITPNTACRIGCISRLKKKGYDVVYEKMIVMPSNWIAATGDGLSIRLLKILPLKVEKVVDDLMSGVKRRTKPVLLDRFFSAFGELEKIGVRFIGKRIHVNETCNHCGLCSSGCPRGNITMQDNQPVFGKRCVLCLKCIYGCPNKALDLGKYKFIIVKDGYDLELLEKRMADVEPAPIEELAKGYLWKGVKEYLLDPELEYIKMT